MVCSFSGANMSKQKTNEAFIKELADKRPDIICLDIYINRDHKLLFRCIKCGKEYTASPSSVLHATQCPVCANKTRARKFCKTHDEFIERLIDIHPDIICLGTYATSKEKIQFQHLKCGHIWTVRPNDINKSCGCPKCSGYAKINHDQFIKELAEKRPDVECLGSPTNSKEKIKFKHLTCGHIWYGTPRVVLNIDKSCPNCAKNGKKSPDRFATELREKRPDIICLEPYVDSRTKILFKNIHCGHIWKTRPVYILRGGGCTICKEWRGETTIRNWLQHNKIEFLPQHIFKDCKNINGLPFDFYIPSLNLCIEHQGGQHFKSVEYWGGELALKQQQARDQIKRDYCKNNNMSLVEIKYTEDIESVLMAYFSNTKYAAIIQSKSQSNI